MTIIYLPVADVKINDKFRITSGDPPERLVQSVGAVGVINPPWVRKTEDSSLINEKYEIIFGYSRFDAAVKAGYKSLCFTSTGSHISDKDILLINIYDNLSQRDLNPVETALCLSKSVEYLSEQKVITELMPALGMNPSRQRLRQFTGILDLPRSIQKHVAEGNISQANAFYMQKMERREQRAVFDLFKKLQTGVNLQKEFLENLFEISRRDRISINDLLEKPELDAILQDSRKKPHQKTHEFRLELRRLRYPNLAGMEEDFDEFQKELSLPGGVQLKPPPFFEGEQYHLQVNFKSVENLSERLEKLSKAFSGDEILHRFSKFKISD